MWSDSRQKRVSLKSEFKWNHLLYTQDFARTPFANIKHCFIGCNKLWGEISWTIKSSQCWQKSTFLPYNKLSSFSCVHRECSSEHRSNNKLPLKLTVIIHTSDFLYGKENKEKEKSENTNFLLHTRLQLPFFWRSNNTTSWRSRNPKKTAFFSENFTASLRHFLNSFT